MFFCVTVKDEKGNIDTDMNSIGNINPFRYRGYYYDTETGFYYLQTRYYDPTICRFINADNYELISTLSQVPGQLNLYAYANNNPIMNTDETGEGVLAAMVLIVFTIIGAVAGVEIGKSQEHTGWQLVEDMVLGAAVGFMAGNIINMFVGMTATIVPLKMLTKELALRLAYRSFALFDATGIIIAALKNIFFQPIEATPPSTPGSPIQPPYTERVVDDFYIMGG